MQTITSGATATASPPSIPSAAQLHTGQLEDYELMLIAMGDINLHHSLPIRPFSPLHRVSEDGFNAVWQLLRDQDFMELCTHLELQLFDLYVSLRDGKYIYQTWGLDGNRVTLSLTEHAKWQALKPRIEKAATSLGGAIHSNRTISMDGICWFYGLAPWAPRHPQEHPAAVAALQEKIASHRLRLDEDFDALDLKRSPTKKDLAKFQLLQQAFPDNALDPQALHTGQVRAKVIDVVNQFLPEEGTSALTHLGKDILSTATTEQIRAMPTVYLEKILQSIEAEKLGVLLLAALDWYGGELGEETSPYIRTKLIANALQYWLSSQSFDNHDLIAGFDWRARSNWGKSYQAIRVNFETHLLTSKRASSEKEAIVIAQLFLSRFPTEFRVRDIPEDLAYRSSVVWVNFVNGVNIIKATGPGLLGRLTFQQLVNLPIQLAEGATQTQLSQIGLARLLPTLDWAVTHGFITQKNNGDYAQDDIDRALSELDKHTLKLNEAIAQIDELPPLRLAMAKYELENLFGNVAFTSDGRRLARNQSGPVTHRDTPFLKGKGYHSYSFLDVLASGMFDDQKKWLVTEADGTTLGTQWIHIDEYRTIKTEAPWPLPGKNWLGVQMGLSPYTQLPDVKTLFDKAFKSHLERITAAYGTLIKSLLASLPYADRQALEFGEVRVHSLRKQTSLVESKDETPEMILPLRARNGLILQATYEHQTTCYELLPRVGMLRRIENLDLKLFGGALKSENWRISKNGTYTVKVLRHKTLPFDWDAHLNGTAPKKETDCQAIIEQLGDTLTATPEAAQNTQGAPLTFSSGRSAAISHHIATELLFVDPVARRKSAFGQTQFESEDEQTETGLTIIKMFVPFWGSIEDLMSGDKKNHAMGALGLFIDVLSFALPIGKFVSGSVRVMTTTARLSLRATLPAFTSLTKKLLISTLGSLNPLDGIPSLFKVLGTTAWKGGRFAIGQLKGLMGRTGHYDFVHSLPQIDEAGRWRPLADGDQLARVRGIDDVPVRNLATSGKSDYRLIDPLSSKPYGPTLSTKDGELSRGRSHYAPLKKTNNQTIVDLSENTRVREVLEIDGRTTLHLDDVPYRLDGDTLRRVDLIDDSEALKLVPCRPPRMLGDDACINSYVTGDPVPTPALGSIDETKGYAPWFGDRLSTPATRPGHEGTFFARDGVVYQVVDNVLTAHTEHLTTLGFAKNWLVPGKEISITLQFRKGIYVRIEVRGAYEGTDDLHRVGAILVPSIDETKTYVFTRLNTDKYYHTTVPAGQSLTEPLTLKRMLKAELAESTEGAELLRVYTGSLGANNVARIYGVNAIERAMETMERIAIRIGTSATPPSNMKWLKVDTSPGEALMFDHSTRMIVTKMEAGATTWSRSKVAPEAFRQRTVEIFDTLFLEPAIVLNNADSALRIDRTMKKLHDLIPRHQRSYSPRNIAYAEVTKADGKREVYVSVSGAQGVTGELPLFRHHFGADHIKVGETTYFNIDMNVDFPRSSLLMTDQGKLLAVPPTIKDIGTYYPALTSKPTSLDSESKLISVIREKYPDPQTIRSVDVATTMPPCDSCTMVMKAFGYDGEENALNVLWH